MINSLGNIASIIVLIMMVLAIIIRLREAYRELPYMVQGGSGSHGGHDTYHEVAFILYKLSKKGRLTGSLDHYKWK